MYCDAISNYDTPALEFGEGKLRMDDTTMVSRFPKGVKRYMENGIMATEFIDGSLKNLALQDGFVFYDRDPITYDLTKPDTIVPGKAYWFKHHFKNNEFFNHNTDGTVVPLVDYDISLQEGWNMIGSPFLSTYKKKSFARLVMIVPRLWMGGQNLQTLSTLVWICCVCSEPRVELVSFKITSKKPDAGRNISNEWVLNLRRQAQTITLTTVVRGRKELAEEDTDVMMSRLPVMDSYVAVRTEITGNGDFDYESDIWSLEESTEFEYKINLGRYTWSLYVFYEIQ